MNRKAVKHYTATVFRQAPAIHEVAQFHVVGHVAGTHEECWQQGKEITAFPVLEFKEIQHVPATV